MALMALFTAPDRWAAGAALRSVTDWRTYHPRYAQPRLGRPSTHPEAYERSSPIDHAEGLEDPLYILHGMVDSNVFAQDSIRLIEKLIDQGSDDEWLTDQLKPGALEQACIASHYPLELRMQEGYDHSYYFIATFIEDHLRHHAEALL